MSVREDKLIENPKEGYDENLEALKQETKKLLEEDVSLDNDIDEEKKNKLTENFKKVDRAFAKQEKLLLQKEQMEANAGEELQSYLKLLEELNTLNEKLTVSIYYDDMVSTQTNLYEGKYCDIKLKSPYYRTQLDSAKLKTKYAKAYKDCCKQTLVKGSVSIAKHKEEEE